MLARWRWQARRWWAKRQAEKAAKAEAESDNDSSKPAAPTGWQSLKEKLTEQGKKFATKVKEYAQAPGKLLKTLKRLDPSALAAALGPALAVAGIVGGAAYVAANEREDDRQIEASDLVDIEERLDGLNQPTTTLRPGSTIRVAAAEDLEASQAELAELQATVDELEAVEPGQPGASQAELDALEAEIEGLDLTDPAEVAALAERLDGLQVADPADVEALQAAVDGLEFAAPADITALEAQIAALPASADPAVVADLEERVEALAAAPAGPTAEDLAAVQESIDELAAGTIDPAVIDELEAAVEALEAIEIPDIPEPFDPTALIEADQMNAESIATAQAAVTAAQTQAAAAETQATAAAEAAEALTESLEQTEAALADIETVFFADLERQWETGVPITLVENNGCSGDAQPFQRSGTGYSATVSTPGPVQSFCVRVAPIPPTIPAACSFPPFGSLRFYWEHGTVTAAARFGATSGANTLIRDNIRTASSGGSSSSFFVLISDSDGPDAESSAPAGEALQFVSRDLGAWDNFYEVEGFVNYETVGGGSTPSVGVIVESISARVEGNLTCS